MSNEHNAPTIISGSHDAIREILREAGAVYATHITTTNGEIAAIYSTPVGHLWAEFRCTGQATALLLEEETYQDCIGSYWSHRGATEAAATRGAPQI